MYGTLSLRSTSGECNVNSTRVKLGVNGSSTIYGKVAYTGIPVHLESCESFTLFPGLFSLKLGVLFGYKLAAKTVDEDPASCKLWISRKEIKSAKI